ncbi:MAG TPA: DUF2283 domain-containing protein [Chroococcales cyanobacterium]|jgi:uncharacterized protein YuzE
MQFEYDAEVDILMVELGDVAENRQRTERLPFGDAIVDLAENGTILAIEIMGASKKYPIAMLQQFPANYAEPIPLASAAKVAGLSQEALKQAILRGRLVGKKIGRNWTTTIAALTEYLNSRQHEGPGSAHQSETEISKAS